ncbi:MAG: hypothetical protein ACJ74W_21140 [Pyrinomonadaceae bacterium]
MNRRCPLCNQELPPSFDDKRLQAQIKQLAAPEISREARRLADEQVDEAQRKVELKYRKQLQQAQRDVAEANRRKERDIERVRREAEKQAKNTIAQQSHARLERLQHDHEQERARHNRETEQLRRKFEEVSRKLEKQTSEQLGSQAEVNLFAELRAAFPGDHIEQVHRGAKGADIIHDVMDGSKQLGRIVYESKNGSTWQNGFVTNAKQYQTRYNTPYVLIVTRTFPRGERGLCTRKDIPIIEPRMACSLAAILRDGIAEIGNMRLSNTARNGKAQELFNYVLSDDFTTRFRQIRESVQELREQQNRERDWHENVWQAQARLHNQIDSRRRDIEEQIKTITRETPGKKKLRIV